VWDGSGNRPPINELGRAPCVGPALKKRPRSPSLRRRVAALGGAGARIAVFGSDNPYPGVYPTRGLEAMHRSIATWVVCRGLKYTRYTFSAVASAMRTGGSAPPLPVLHSHAPRLIAPRGGGRNEETPSQVKSRINLRDTRSRRQAGAMRPARRARHRCLGFSY